MLTITRPFSRRFIVQLFIYTLFVLVTWFTPVTTRPWHSLVSKNNEERSKVEPLSLQIYCSTSHLAWLTWLIWHLQQHFGTKSQIKLLSKTTTRNHVKNNISAQNLAKREATQMTRRIVFEISSPNLPIESESALNVAGTWRLIALTVQASHFQFADHETLR